MNLQLCWRPVSVTIMRTYGQLSSVHPVISGDVRVWSLGMSVWSLGMSVWSLGISRGNWYWRSVPSFRHGGHCAPAASDSRLCVCVWVWELDLSCTGELSHSLHSGSRQTGLFDHPPSSDPIDPRDVMSSALQVLFYSICYILYNTFIYIKHPSRETFM